MHWSIRANMLNCIICLECSYSMLELANLLSKAALKKIKLIVEYAVDKLDSSNTTIKEMGR